MLGVAGCDSEASVEEEAPPAYRGSFVANYGGSDFGTPTGQTRGTALLTDERLLVMERTSGDSTLAGLTFDLASVREDRLGVYNFADDDEPIAATVQLDRGQGVEQWDASSGALTVEAVRDDRLEGRFNFPVTIDVEGSDSGARLQVTVDFTAAREAVLE